MTRDMAIQIMFTLVSCSPILAIYGFWEIEKDFKNNKKDKKLCYRYKFAAAYVVCTVITFLLVIWSK